jgi:hypothetical protein
LAEWQFPSLKIARRPSNPFCFSCRWSASISRHRIGYGAGYYDRSLAGLTAFKKIHAAGVGYGVCEVAAVPYDGHDKAWTPL